MNKAAGISSHDAVAAMRRLAPGTRVGHGGTLDPAAVGVLPLCLGRATRVAEYLFDLRKGYRASITLGVTTDTGDAEGTIVSRTTPPSLTAERVATLLKSLTGRQQQEVPAYAAAKYRGRPLYDYARRGEKIPSKKREIEIYRLELIALCPDAAAPQIVCEVECSRGTYIRALAVEIGNRLGCGAYLSSLERSFVGPLTIEDAHTMEELTAAAAADELAKVLLPLDRALLHLEALTLSDGAVDDLRNGRSVPWELPAGPAAPATGGPPLRIYDSGGRFRALARLEKDGAGHLLKTEKFLSP